jgi:ParB family transcriptional regulator, chromosome partitioning protein
MESDRKGVLRRAEKLRQSERMSASAVVAALIGKQRGAGAAPQEIRIAGSLAGRVSWDSRGQATIRFVPGVVHSENVKAIVDSITAAIDAGATKP